MSTTEILPDGRVVTLSRANRKGREVTRYEVYTDGQCIGVVASGFLNGENARGGLFWVNSTHRTALRSRKYAIEFLIRDYVNGIIGSTGPTVIA